MLNRAEKERLEHLEAKAYFEWGLNQEESDELDSLIAKANQQ